MKELLQIHKYMSFWPWVTGPSSREQGPLLYKLNTNDQYTKSTAPIWWTINPCVYLQAVPGQRPLVAGIRRTATAKFMAVPTKELQESHHCLLNCGWSSIRRTLPSPCYCTWVVAVWCFCNHHSTTLLVIIAGTIEHTTLKLHQWTAVPKTPERLGERIVAIE